MTWESEKLLLVLWWPRWFSPPANWACSMPCWAHSAPSLRRRSAAPLKPVWMVRSGCWPPARACSSSTRSSGMDKVSSSTSSLVSSTSLVISHSAPSLLTHHLSRHLCFSAVQQHRAGQTLPDPLQPTVPLPVHPVQLQNHLPVLALPHWRCQVSWVAKDFNLKK